MPCLVAFGRERLPIHPIAVGRGGQLLRHVGVEVPLRRKERRVRRIKRGRQEQRLSGRRLLQRFAGLADDPDVGMQILRQRPRLGRPSRCWTGPAWRSGCECRPSRAPPASGTGHTHRRRRGSSRESPSGNRKTRPRAPGACNARPAGSCSRRRRAVWAGSDG